MVWKDDDLEGFRKFVIPAWINHCTVLDKDKPILLIGKEGVGKSTLALLLGILLCKAQGKEFSIKKNIHYSINSIIKTVMKESSSGDVQILDEAAVTGGYTKDASTFTNRQLNKMFMTCRSKNNIIMILIPRLTAIDNEILNRVKDTGAAFRIVERLDNYAWAWFWDNRTIKRGLGTAYRRNKKRQYFKKPDGWQGFCKFRSIQNTLGNTIWNEYKNHKSSSLQNLFVRDQTNLKDLLRIERDKRILRMKQLGLSLRLIGHIEEMHHSSINDILQKNKLVVGLDDTTSKGLEIGGEAATAESVQTKKKILKNIQTRNKVLKARERKK